MKIFSALLFGFPLIVFGLTNFIKTGGKELAVQSKAIFGVGESTRESVNNRIALTQVDFIILALNQKIPNLNEIDTLEAKEEEQALVQRWLKWLDESSKKERVTAATKEMIKQIRELLIDYKQLVDNIKIESE